MSQPPLPPPFVPVADPTLPTIDPTAFDLFDWQMVIDVFSYAGMFREFLMTPQVGTLSLLDGLAIVANVIMVMGLSIGFITMLLRKDTAND